LSDNDDFDANRDINAKLIFAQDRYQMDVPVWLEIMKRTDRVRQHTYAVRVLPPDPSSTSDILDGGETPQNGGEKQTTNHVAEFVRLRTGRDLAQVM
jgi:hypothetical protein